MKLLKEHGTWLVPLLITVFVGALKVYSIGEHVHELRLQAHDIETNGLARLRDAEWRINIIERYCCQDEKEKEKEEGDGF